MPISIVVAGELYSQEFLQTGHTIKGNLEKSILKKGMRLILHNLDVELLTS
jgi:hypothetical protein